MSGQSIAIQTDLLMAAKAEAVKAYLRPNSNIVGVGIGKKKVDEEWKPCVRIYVVEKLDDPIVPSGQLAPKDIDGVPVDVIPLSGFGRNGVFPVKDTGTVTRPGSPIRVKTDLTNINEGARGTLGAVVTDGEDSYILGCNHILAVNGRVPTDVDTAAIVSAEFVGKENEIASRCEFVPLRRDRPNLADCAIAKLTNAKKVKTDFPPGTVRLASTEPGDPSVDKVVTKVGAGTGFSRGQVVDCSADLYVPYSFMDPVLFVNQIMIQAERDGEVFATNGDSGALVVEEESGKAVGMIFACSGSFAVATPLKTVFNEIGGKVNRTIRLVVGEPVSASTVGPDS